MSEKGEREGGVDKSRGIGMEDKTLMQGKGGELKKERERERK